MKLKAATQHRLFQPAIGAALTALCGLALWKMPLGEIWVNASYDYLFLFGARPVTNQVALILMDNMAFNELHQIRGQPWARTNHANLLNKLADAGCPLVVFDVVFAEAADPTSDKALAQSLARQRRVVLAAEQARGAYPGADSAQPTLPAEMFLEAAHTNWGVAWFGPDFDLIVRKHWPFGAQGPHPSLPWVAAQQAGAKLSAIPAERWLRYYGPDGAWVSLSYRFALTQATNYFRDKIVFIGQKPQSALPDTEEDKFNTPYSRWSEGSVGGVELLATAFLNLMNGDWLRRPEWRLEALVLCATGLCLGGGLCQVRLPANRSSTSCPTPRARRRSRPARGRPEPHSNAWCGTPSPQYAVGRAVHSVRTYRNLYTAHHTWVNSVFLVDPLTGWMEFTGTRY